MRDVYLSHFGLREPPFSKEIPDGDLWLPSSKQAVVDELVDAVEERTSVVLVGDPGVGKTCVLRAFRKRLPEAAYRLTYCHNVTLGRRDFYRQLCIALGLSPSVTAAGVFHNYEWDSRALLSLVMVGLPELLDRLSMRRNRSLFSRLHRRLRIDPLSPVDTGEYIGMRLHRAGCERELFASDAIAMIHEAAMGGMRDADRLATAALREAARKKRKLVERDAVARTIDAHTNGDTGA